MLKHGTETTLLSTAPATPSLTLKRGAEAQCSSAVLKQRSSAPRFSTVVSKQPPLNPMPLTEVRCCSAELKHGAETILFSTALANLSLALKCGAETPR